MSVFCTPSTIRPEYFSRCPLTAKPLPDENEIPSSSAAVREAPGINCWSAMNVRLVMESSVICFSLIR